jgi:nucleotide-binding universal stress UspA family protein
MTILVGTDGTASGGAAVAWAAAEAQQRRTPLHIVHAIDGDSPESRFDIGNENIDVSRVLAEAVVAAAEKRARTVAPGLAIETDIVVGHPVRRLLGAARDAELLVTGSRGPGGVTGRLTGSVSRRLAADSPCPIVVVCGPGEPGGPVAVGADNSPAAGPVLRTAFGAAAEQACPLVVIRSFRPSMPVWLANVLPSHRTAEEDAAERALLKEQVDPWRTEFPDVAVETVLTYDSPGAALVAASRWARLVVAGSRGHGVVGGTLLGSTSLHLLHHAASPVLIAHHSAALEESR